jgi:hypothetical protein
MKKNKSETESMHIISRRALQEFALKHPQSETPLDPGIE